MSEEHKLKNAERTEEIQSIIERMPTKFGKIITIFVLVIVTAFLILGCIVRYPDVVRGGIVISTESAPIKLTANNSGRLMLNNFKSQDSVNEGQYIAVIQNSADLADIGALQTLLKQFNINTIEQNSIKFPVDMSLGDLNTQYFAFINAYEDFKNHHSQNMMAKQESHYKKMDVELNNSLQSSIQKSLMARENLRLINKFHTRDSILYKRKVITESEFDKSDMNLISIRDAYGTTLNNITIIKEQIQENISKLEQVNIQKTKDTQTLKLNLTTAFTDLLDNFKSWEERYVFKAPVKGKIEFANFWNNNQFIQAGTIVFTVIPTQNKMVGQMTLPSSGAGKVLPGQEVIIKLENYPYREYGSIKGKVLSISSTTNTLKTDKGDLETYLINVSLPEGLKTNYGAKLLFKFEIQGTGEIITKDRRLLERLFDNMKYALSK